MKSLRVIGQNIQLQMNSKGYSIEELADRLGYSVLEVHRIIEGNLSVPLQTMKKIANELSTTLKNLMEEKDENEYKPLLDCMGSYKNASNKDKILDYIDLYIQLESRI